MKKMGLVSLGGTGRDDISMKFASNPKKISRKNLTPNEVLKQNSTLI